MNRRNAAAARKLAPLAPQFVPWHRETIPFARDLLLIGVIIFYVIGFAYQTGKMQRFDIGVDLDDQQLTSLFSWAAEAFRDGAIAYVRIAVVALALLLLAALVKRTFAAGPFCCVLFFALVTVSVLVLVVGSSWFAWKEGSAATSCMSHASSDDADVRDAILRIRAAYSGGPAATAYLRSDASGVLLHVR